MAMPVLTHHRWTREEVLAIPDDGKRYELVDGELLVSPSTTWKHQRGVLQLCLRIAPYVSTTGIGEVLLAPADLDLRSGQLVQPDVFVVEPAGDSQSRSWEDAGIPLLAIEVISPSTAKYDRGIKRLLYQRSSVPVYWIVDLDARQVEVWTPGADFPQISSGSVTWQPDAAIQPLVIDLVAFFREVWGDRPRHPALQ